MKLKIEYISIILSIIFPTILIFLFKFSIPNGIVTGIIIASLPLLIYQYYEANYEEKLENQFYKFAIDLAELLKSGLSLPTALEYISKNNYNELNEYIYRLYARISWGIGIEESFNMLSEEIPSKDLNLAIKTILEIYKSGGSLENGLETSVKTLLEIKRLKEERKSAIHENILDSFIVFVFFLGIIATFSIFLIPFMSQINNNGNNISPQFFNNILYSLSIIESIFGGLALGKMYNGSYKYGVRFVIIFLLLTLILFNILIPIMPKGSELLNIGNTNI